MKRKVSIFTLIISCILVLVATYVVNKFLINNEPEKLVSASTMDCDVLMTQTRLKDYKLIQPLILTDIFNESGSLKSLHLKLEQYINEVKSSQQASDVSVYFRKLNDGAWFCIEPNQTYNPASMSKIIELITYLKEAEENPAILKKKIFFPTHFTNLSEQNIKNFTLKEHQTYTVLDLLTYMIKYSDNDATILLNLNINMRIYTQIFTDLNIPIPPLNGEYYITATDFSKFMRAMYNGTYLRPQYSEFGLQLLTESTFYDGITKGVGPSVLIAHKFGERIIGNQSQLHEFGIVYIKKNPYLIGIMTKGTSLDQLKEIISEISRITYTEYLAMYPETN